MLWVHLLPNGFNRWLLVGSSSVVLLATIVALINTLIYGRYQSLCAFFMVLVLVIIGFAIHEENAQRIKPAKLYKQPNVIIIGLDSLRPDYLGYFNKHAPSTPHLDAFLRKGTVFRESYSPLARTFPSWVSILTGNHPLHTAVRANLTDASTALKQPNLAQLLRAAGYQTIYGTDEPRFSDITKEFGFDRLIGVPGGAAEFLIGSLSDFPLMNVLLQLPFARFLFPYTFANRGVEVTYHPDDFLHLIKLALAEREDKPLFLALHLCLAHWPHRWAHDDQTEDLILPEQYSRAVEGLDVQFGRLVKILKNSNLLEHTLLILLSDHGVTLGLPNDRLTNPANYRGIQKPERFLKRYKLSSAKEASLEKDDFSYATSYGQGTDILSLKQFHVLMALRGYGVSFPERQLCMKTSLLDVAPTILDFLKLPPLARTDGLSLLPYLLNDQVLERPLFLETGDTVNAIETDKIIVTKVVKESLKVYRLNLQNGEVVLTDGAVKSLIRNKQRAVIWGDWMLAFYPTVLELQPKKVGKSFVFAVVSSPSYYVLTHLPTGFWTIGLDSPFADRAPKQKLSSLLKSYYADEIPKTPDYLR